MWGERSTEKVVDFRKFSVGVMKHLRHVELSQMTVLSVFVKKDGGHSKPAEHAIHITIWYTNVFFRTFFSN